MTLRPWRIGTIIQIKDETNFTRRFFIKVNESETFDFKPGQFVTLDLPIHEEKSERCRSYSIASWPDGTNVFELLIVWFNGGAGSNYLFNNVKVGSEVTFQGPQGIFNLPENIEKDLFFICTGTGIAPFRSMLKYIQLYRIPHENLYLIFGCRTQKDLLYHEEMKALESEIEDFYYMPTLSREGWDGCKGYVHSMYEQICKKNNNGCKDMQNLKSPSFYLCGNKIMVDDARQKITALGYEFIDKPFGA